MPDTERVLDAPTGPDQLIDPTGGDDVHSDGYRLVNGRTGEALTIRSANPANFHRAISDTGAMLRQDIWAKLFLPDRPDPSLVDLDGFRYALKAGYGARGAHIGGTPESASLFVDDMTAFWLSTLTPTATTG